MGDNRNAAVAETRLRLADEWANRDRVDPEYRPVVVEYNLRLAQIHATLAVAEATERVHEMLARLYDARPTGWSEP